MSEQQLKDFGAHAETLVEIPDFGQLDRRGHETRVRRRAGVAAALAAMLAVVGVTVTQIHRNDVDDRPITPPGSLKARPYKGGTMKTLEAGTYQLHPSLVESDLTAQLTLPDGWNSWIGPNRFDGHAPGRSNSEALDYLTWYVGALVLEVDGVNTRGCGSPVNHLTTTHGVVAALRRAFAMEVVREPQQVRRFGYPATRMRLRVTKEFEKCDEDTLSVFHSTGDGFIQYAGPGTLLDVWLVDVGGTPIYVQRAWTPNAPESAIDELDSVIDSIQFGTR